VFSQPEVYENTQRSPSKPVTFRDKRRYFFGANWHFRPPVKMSVGRPDYGPLSLLFPDRHDGFECVHWPEVINRETEFADS